MSNNTVIKISPEGMRSEVFAWIGNGRTDESKQRTFELYMAMFGMELVGADVQNNCFVIRKSDTQVVDGFDFKLRPITGLLVGVASCTPKKVATNGPLGGASGCCGVGAGCCTPSPKPVPVCPPPASCIPAPVSEAEYRKALAESREDRIAVLRKAITSINSRHLKAGDSVQTAYTRSAPRANLGVYRGTSKSTGKKAYLAILTSNPPKSVVGIEATTLKELEKALTRLVTHIKRGDKGAAPKGATVIPTVRFEELFGNGV